MTDDDGVTGIRETSREGAGADDRRLMARSLAGLYAAGALLALLTIVLPHPDAASELGVVVVVAGAVVVAGLLFTQAARVPAWAPAAVLAVGTTLISLVAYFAGGRPSPLIFFYLWIFLYSAYFFTPRILVAQSVWVAVNFAVVLAVREPADGAETWWLVGLGSMLVALALVAALRDRAERLIASLNREAHERELAQRELSLHRDHLELLVDERTAALQVAYRELESFSYSVSHDLRAPLRSLDGFSQALTEDYGDRLDADGVDYLQRIRAASQRMSRLIDDMLQLARLSRREMRREHLDLSALALSVGEEIRNGEVERQVELRVAPGIEVDADPQLLRVVLQNLIGNAWKFTGKQQRATIEVGVSELDAERAYFVRDDGVGFEMEYADKLFGAFQRLHSSEDYDGTGIGLANVQRVIHRHGGRVWAESEAGHGATFFFTLPSSRKAEDERHDSAG